MSGQRPAAGFVSARSTIAPLSQRRRLPLEDGRGEGEAPVGRAPPRVGAGEQLVGEQAPRELIGERTDLVASKLLGSHVGRRPYDRTRGRERGRSRRGLGGHVGVDRALLSLGDAEVEDLRHAVLADDYVLGLHVPVDDAGLVRRHERARDVAEDGEPSIDRQVPPPDVGAEGRALEVLHGQVRRSLDLADVEHRDHVRVVQRSGALRFAQEALALLRRGRAGVGEHHLEGYAAFQRGVGRQVDRAHSPLAEAVHDLVPAESSPRS
jgi:hypothetical protein